MRTPETMHLGRTGANNFSSIDKPVLDRFSTGSILDIGCANGDVVKYLRDRGVEAYGIDGDEWAVDHFSDPSIREYLYRHDSPKVRPCWTGRLTQWSPQISQSMLKNSTKTTT